MSDELRLLEAEIQSALDAFRARFVRPDEVRVTLIARAPWLDDGDIVVTNDTFRELRRCLERQERLEVSDE